MSGAEWMLGNVGKAKRNGLAVSKAQLDDVERLFDAAVDNAANLGTGVGKVARLAAAMLASGLTRRAICVLLQDRLGKGPGGKPAMSIERLDDVLNALVDLGQYLDKPGRKP